MNDINVMEFIPSYCGDDYRKSSLRKAYQGSIEFIIKNKHDYEYAKEIICHCKPQCPVFFQPVWGISPIRLASWILNDGLPVRLGLQLHKVIWGTKRGV